MEKGSAVYIVSCDHLPGRFKIGKTKDIESRMRAYHTHLPGEERIEHIRYVNNMDLVEKCLHDVLAKYRIDNTKEWFKGDRDAFKVELDIIADFINTRESYHGQEVPLGRILKSERCFRCGTKDLELNDRGYCELCREIKCRTCKNFYLQGEMTIHQICLWCDDQRYQ